MTKPSRSEPEDVGNGSASKPDLVPVQIPQGFKPSRSDPDDFRPVVERSHEDEVTRLHYLEEHEAPHVVESPLGESGPKKWYAPTDYYQHVRAAEEKPALDDTILGTTPRSEPAVFTAAPTTEVPDDFMKRKWYQETGYYGHLAKAEQEMAIDEDAPVPTADTLELHALPATSAARPPTLTKPPRSEEFEDEPAHIQRAPPAFSETRSPSHKPSRSEA